LPVKSKQVSKSHIRIVEDDPAIGQSLPAGLEHHGLDARLCTAGIDGMEHVRKRSSHLIIQDIRRLDGSGFDFYRQKTHQERLHRPVIMLHTQQDEFDKILGLDRDGHRQSCAKPFSLRELISRIQAYFRRTYGDYAPAESASLPARTWRWLR